ncbi:MAG: NAD(P)/FAD-dependent oxidoreductase [Firmicutes bacterium]|nr:NAD(P)/FAD-dependent oxidoreductase [Bacillota bacterium]
MSKDVVILGGGTGGTMVANHIARTMRNEVRSGEITITQITSSDKHIYQPSFLFVAINHARVQDYTRSQKSLLSTGVNLVVDTATKIDAASNTITLQSGKTVSYDILVIATGAYPDFSSVPGLAEAADNFYTPEGAEKLRDKLLSFEGGKIVITIDVPHKCPVAPMELVFMLDDLYRRKGIRDKVDLLYTYPIGRLHSLEPCANWAAPKFEELGINSEIFFNVESVDPDKKVVKTVEGSEVPFDILISIPAHRGAKVIQESGLGDEGGFIPTNRHLLKAEGHDNIYVLGDATNLPISKAGSTAHYEADVVAENIISELRGLPPSHYYDGKVFCFVEAGLDSATYITFSYDKPPAPVPDSEMIHWFKLAFNEMYWLSVRGML